MIEKSPNGSIVEAISEYYGPRCNDHMDGCPCCEVWAEYDALLSTPTAAPAPVAVEGMPERIWAWRNTDPIGSSVGWNEIPGSCRQEYIRADLAPTDNTALVEALLDEVWNEAVEQAAVVARSCVHMTPDPDNAIRIMLNGRAKLYPASCAALASREAAGVRP